MDGEVLRDDQWEKVKPFVPGGRKRQAGPAQRRSAPLRCFALDGSLGRPERCPAVMAAIGMIPSTVTEVSASQVLSSQLFHNLLLRNKSAEERATLVFAQEAGSNEISIRGQNQFIPACCSKDVWQGTLGNLTPNEFAR
jgi:hypothetical protein